MESLARIDITEFLSDTTDGFTTVSIPCREFAKQDVDFRYIDTPFMLFTEGEWTAVLANIRWDIEPK
jgi:beta-glucosidase